MANRKVPLVTGEHYHVYNRGVDKRIIFNDVQDVNRFIRSMVWFNNVMPIGSLKELYLNLNKNSKDNETEKLVNMIAYCLNPNHFHLILEQLVDGGISEYMKRLGGGFTCHFNDRNKRSGSLFQGTFKSKHIDSNEYLLHLSAYVNLNDKVHNFRGLTPEIIRSSWNEYINENTKGICEKEIVLSQFDNCKRYKKFAEESLVEILKNRESLKEIEFGG